MVRERMSIALLASSLVFASGQARGQEARVSLERVLWTGDSSGVPSALKRAVLTSVYVLSVGSVAAAGYFAYTWVEAGARATTSERRGVCFELSIPDCDRFLQAQADVRRAQRFTAASAALAGGFLLGGVVLAQYWENVSLGVSVSPVAPGLMFTSRF